MRALWERAGYGAVQVLVVALSVALAASWIAADRTPPAWDQAHYLGDALQYANAFQQGGVRGLGHAFFSVERFYGPGYPALLFPFVLALGPSVQAALVANLCLWIVLLLTVAAIGRRLFGRPAGLIAMAVTATTPILLVLLHQVLVDLAAVTWAAVTVLALLRSSHFTRWRPAAVAGAFAGLGLLTKATVLVFLAGPVLVMAARAALRLRASPAGARLRALGILGLTAAVALAVAAPWYVASWDATVGYIQSATQGELAVGVGADDPLAPAAVAALAVKVLSDMSLSLAAGLAGVALVLLWKRAHTRGRPWTWLLLGSWALVPLGVLAASHNQDPRYAAIAFPALALAFAGLWERARPAAWRAAAAASVLAFSVAQIGLAELPPVSPGRDRILGAVPAAGPEPLVILGPAYAPADPRADDGTPVMRALEALARGAPARILVAEDDHVFNLNTLTWLAASRHDRFTFVVPDRLTGDPSEVAGYDFAIYLPASVVARRNPDARSRLLNGKTAATVFGDQLFGLFGRSRHEVPIRDGEAWILQR